MVTPVCAQLEFIHAEIRRSFRTYVGILASTHLKREIEALLQDTIDLALRPLTKNAVVEQIPGDT